MGFLQKLPYVRHAKEKGGSRANDYRPVLSLFIQSQSNMGTSENPSPLAARWIFRGAHMISKPTCRHTLTKKWIWPLTYPLCCDIIKK